jgi:CheY-like chemotaxis protein
MPVVLIADPVVHTRDLLRVVFGDELDCHVVAVEGLATALLMAREVRPDLVVLELDARRPAELELVRSLKSDPSPGLPVIALTAWGQLLTCEQALAAGCDECIAKPFDLEDLLARARVLIAGRATVANGR